ncbi:hypothetical protein ACFLUV_07355, partial [Elusimicrobiota bacterium]
AANVVKQVVPWHLGDEPDASFLRGLIRRWAAFLGEFPDDSQDAFMHIVLSAFTEDAIRAVTSEMMEESGLAEDSLAMSEQGLRPVVFPTEAELTLAKALKGAVSKADIHEKELEYESNEKLNEVNSKKGKDEDPQVRSEYDLPGLNRMNLKNPTGTVGSIEGLIVGVGKSATREAKDAKGIYTEKKLRVDMGLEIDEELMAKVPKRERKNGMSYAVASLVVKDPKALSITLIMNSTSRAAIGGGFIPLGDAIDDIWNNNRFANVQYCNNGAGDNVGGALMWSKEMNVVESIEGNLLKYAERELFEGNHSAIANGTIIMNSKRLFEVILDQLVKVEKYKSRKEAVQAAKIKFISSTEAERRKMFAEQIDENWPLVHSLKDRTQEEIGLKWKWEVLVTECVLAQVMGYVQREDQMGRDSIRYQETTAIQSYIDDKTVEQNNRRSGWQATHRHTPVKMNLARPLPQHPGVGIQDSIKWAQLYNKHGLIKEARIILNQAKDLLKEGETVFRKGQKEKYSKMIKDQRAALKTQEKGKVLGVDMLRKQILNMSRMFNSEDFIPYTIGKDMRHGLLVDLKDLLLATEAEIKKHKNKETLRELEAIKYEFQGLFDSIADIALELKDYKDIAKIKGYRDFPHKMKYVIDKDATFVDPGRHLNPMQAKKFVYALASGAVMDILTGSAAHEAVDHMLSTIRMVIDEVDLPEITKTLALERLRILACDGSIILALDGETHVRKPIVNNRIYNEKEGRWEELSTLYQENADGTENMENRAQIWRELVKSYLYQLFSEERLRNDLGMAKGRAKRTAEFKDFVKNFIDKLEMKPEDLPSLYDMSDV